MNTTLNIVQGMILKISNSQRTYYVLGTLINWINSCCRHCLTWQPVTPCSTRPTTTRWRRPSRWRKRWSSCWRSARRRQWTLASSCPRIIITLESNAESLTTATPSWLSCSKAWHRSFRYVLHCRSKTGMQREQTTGNEGPSDRASFSIRYRVVHKYPSKTNKKEKICFNQLMD